MRPGQRNVHAAAGERAAIADAMLMERCGAKSRGRGRGPAGNASAAHSSAKASIAWRLRTRGASGRRRRGGGTQSVLFVFGPGSPFVSAPPLSS